MIYASIIFLASFVLIPLFHSVEKPLKTNIKSSQTPPPSATGTQSTLAIKEITQQFGAPTAATDNSTQTTKSENDKETESADLLED